MERLKTAAKMARLFYLQFLTKLYLLTAVSHSITKRHHRELHIRPDWLLIYQIKNDVLILELSRTDNTRICSESERTREKGLPVRQPLIQLPKKF